MSITNELEKSMSKFLNPLFTNMYSYTVERYGSVEFSPERLDVHVQVTNNELTRTIVLALYIHHSNKQLHLPNIFIPQGYRNQGYGLGLIHEILVIANKYNYDLFIVDMVDSFYRRMISKGAQEVDNDGIAVDDAVLITNDTQLLFHRP